MICFQLSYPLKKGFEKVSVEAKVVCEKKVQFSRHLFPTQDQLLTKVQSMHGRYDVRHSAPSIKHQTITKNNDTPVRPHATPITYFRFIIISISSIIRSECFIPLTFVIITHDNKD